jgi:signal transduction histidine kinase
VTEVGPGGDRVNLLLVDDDPASLLALESILAPLEQNLVAVRSGREALRQLLRQEFALVVLDVRVADIDGFEIARLIRSRPATRSIPIIFVTAYAQAREHMERAYRLRAADFIFKPYPPGFMRSKVAAFVDLQLKQRAIARLLQEAQEASQAKSEFLNMAAHELRTPLSVIMGYTSMLVDGSISLPPEGWLRPLDVIQDKLIELNDIVEDLLVASRLAAGRMPSQAEVLDMRKVVEEAVERAMGRAQLMGGEILVEMTSDPVAVLADPHQIARILDNLFNNALTYTARSPWARVSLRGGRNVIVEVEDHGVGIPEEMRESIFESFIRLANPTVTPRAGYGLGLYIGRSLAGLNGGNLYISRSEAGVGSCFALRLPLYKAAQVKDGSSAFRKSGDLPDPLADTRSTSVSADGKASARTTGRRQRASD